MDVLFELGSYLKSCKICFFCGRQVLKAPEWFESSIERWYSTRTRTHTYECIYTYNIQLCIYRVYNIIRIYINTRYCKLYMRNVVTRCGRMCATLGPWGWMCQLRCKESRQWRRNLVSQLNHFIGWDMAQSHQLLGPSIWFWNELEKRLSMYVLSQFCETGSTSKGAKCSTS